MSPYERERFERLRRPFIRIQNVLDAASRRQPDLIVYPDTVVCLAEFPRTFVVSQEAFRVLVGSLQERGLRN